jgi:phage portal protein BeeE
VKSWARIYSTGGHNHVRLNCLTLHPYRFWATHTEFTRSVFSAASQTTHQLELDMSGFLRSDPAERWNAWKIAVEAGILTPDEIRAEEGWNPRPAQTA